MKRNRIWARIPSTIVVSTALSLVTGLLLCSGGSLRAGGSGGVNAPGAGAVSKVPLPPAFGVSEDDDTILLVDKAGRFSNLTPTTRVVALDLPRSELRRDGNDEKLVQWVQRGGIVWTHTDAAQLFGFRTASLRNALELNGRAVPAAPWNAHLFTRGVQRVYYTLRSNSVYAAAHPRALMLLRAVDNPAQPGAQLFVAAYLPLGKGAVLMAPPQLHKRADGVAFQTAMKGISTGQTPVVEIPVTQVEAVAALAAQFARERTSLAAAQSYLALWQAMASARARDRERALTALDRAVAMAAAPPDVHRSAAELFEDLGQRDKAQVALRKAGPAEARSEAVGLGLMLTQEELDRAEAVFGAGASAVTGKAATRAAAPSAAAALARVWMGRVYYQLGSNESNLQRADQQFQAALKLDETSAPANTYEGYLLTSAGRNARQPSQRRAELLLLASQFLGRAQPGSGGTGSTTATTTDPGKGKTPGKAGTDPGKAGAGAPATNARGTDVADQVRREAEIAAAEPPNLSTQGSILIRSFPGDAAATALQAILYSRRVAEQYGFHLDEVEILSFPTQALFVRYLRLVEAPRGEFDIIAEAIDNKVITHLQATGGGIAIGKYGGGRTAVLTPIFGHIYGHALMNSFAEGGTLVPGWLKEGIAAMIEPQRPDPLPVLRSAQQQRLMFNPTDLNSPIDAVAADETRRLVFQAQAHSLVTHLARVGPQGTLLRVVQELGSGKDVDQALQGVINGTFDDLYNDWARRVMNVR